MKKASLLRTSAKKYATGNIRKGDYIVYRKGLLDAIESGSPLPEIPKEWVSYKGSISNPEFQALMTSFHDMQEDTTEKKGLDIKVKISIVVGIIALSALAWFFISNQLANETTKEPALTTSKTSVNTKPFIKKSLMLISKKNWQVKDVVPILEDLQLLSNMEKTAIKRNLIYKQLQSQAVERISQYDKNSKEYLKIDLLIKKLK